MKRLIITIGIVLFTFLATTFAVVAIILNSDKILNSFSIISVDNVGYTYVVKFEKVKAAEYYDIVVYNTRNVQIFSQSAYKTTATINVDNLEYNGEYKLIVYAYDGLGESLAVNNPYKFKYNEPTFSATNSLILHDDEEYFLIIDGDLSKKDYKIRLSDNGFKLKEEVVKGNEYLIAFEYYSRMKQKLDIELLDGGSVIDKITLYNQMSPVSDLKITSPQNGKLLNYNDVVFTFTGGDNATEYLVQIYNGKKLIREKEVRSNRVVIASEIFTKAETYRLRVVAKYEDYPEYTKMAEITFTMNEKDTLRPAYINVNPKYVKPNSQIILTNPNPDGLVYFTLDGSDPTTNGIRYEGPIIVTNKLTIKTVVMEPKKNNSVVSTFDINVGEKKNYSVYLSPSNQAGNIGVGKVGYTNEMKEMNHLTNFIEKRLKDHGVKVYRNSPYGNINLWTADSKYYGVDLHLAIHSNGSSNHKSYGIETWINEETSKTYSLANLFQTDLMKIYYTTDPKGNRGVKYANGALGECNDLYLPFGILLEIGHHDWELDAAWIMENKELIGNTVANTILKYFGLL